MQHIRKLKKYTAKLIKINLSYQIIPVNLMENYLEI